jgi:hypothetical protein
MAPKMEYPKHKSQFFPLDTKFFLGWVAVLDLLIQKMTHEPKFEGPNPTAGVTGRKYKKILHGHFI